MTGTAYAVAERAARTSFGRLVAILAARGGDLAAAQDALADALATALRVWPARGIPDNPDAWLLTAARRGLGHARARQDTAAAGVATMILLDDERAAADAGVFGDARLALMFVCAHPAIDPGIQAPLMLQAVLGLDAARIAASFLVSPAAMGQRLVRAKAKIRDAGIAFAVPPADRLAERTGAVLAAVYAAYATGWEDAGPTRNDLADEAIWLARLVVDLLPDDPEAAGLMALMLYCEARRPARRDADRRFVPLDRQDSGAWDWAMIGEAEALLRAAARYGRPGRFQLEAAIQSLHVANAAARTVPPGALLALYDRLIAVAPSVGAAIARAAALAEQGEAAAALAALDSLAQRAATHQPYWATRARVLHLLGDAAAASAAAAHAAALSDDAAVRDFLGEGGLFGA